MPNKQKRVPGKGAQSIAALMQFDGRNNIVAFNENRPFDERSLNDIISRFTATVPSGSGSDMCILGGQGVPHVIQNNLIFRSFIKNEAFILAIQRLFRVVRMALRSNLVYTQDDFAKMTEASVMCYAKAKALQLYLKYYSFELGSAPHVNKQLQQATLNMNDTGLANADVIEMLKEPIENILLQYEKVRAKLQLLLIPTKLKNFIDYFLDSHFVDQSAVNAQIYQNVLRACPSYSLDASNELVYTGDWDVKDGKLMDIYYEADAILSKYAIAYADLDKTGLYSRPDLISITEDNIKQVFHFRNDMRFFTYLINNYAAEAKTIMEFNLFKAPYIRIDVKQVSPDDLLMATMALSKYTGYDAPFEFVSQAVYYTKPLKSGVPINVQVHVTSSGSGQAIYEVSDDEQAVYQTNGFYNETTEMQHNTSASTSTFVGALDNPLDYSVASGASSATVSPLKTVTLSAEFNWGDTNAKRCKLLVLNMSSYGTQYAIWQRIKNVGNPGASGSLELVYGTFAQFQTDLTGADTGTVLFTSTSASPAGCSWTFTTNNNGFKWSIEYPFTISFTAGANTAKNIFARANNVYANAECVWNISISVTTTSGSWDITIKNQDFMKRYIDDVEYHFPVVVKYLNRAKVNDTNWYTSAEHGLYKEDIIPIIVDASNVKASLYWSFLGLFDMYGKAQGSVKQGGGKRHSGYKNPKKEEEDK